MDYSNTNIKTLAAYIGMETTYLSRLKCSITTPQRHLIFKIVSDVEDIIDSKHRVYRRVYDYLMASAINHERMFRNPVPQHPRPHAREDFMDKVTAYWLGYNERPGDVELYDLTSIGYKQLDPGFHPIKEVTE